MSSTPLVKIDNIYFKREDHNITGSAKDRAMEEQVKNLMSHNLKSAVISSTGNAAISAIHFCKIHHIQLTIFLSPKTNSKKLALIKKQHKHIIVSNKPISDAFKYAKTTNCYNLRQSIDPTALIGYSQIGQELKKQLLQISSLFIPVGSGTTLLGLSKTLPKSTKIFAIQPACHPPISSIFDQDFQKENTTLTTSLSVKSLPLKNKIVAAIKNSHGSGLVVQNRSALTQFNYLKKNKLHCSAEGALALAGFHKAKKLNLLIGNYPVILLTGTNR